MDSGILNTITNAFVSTLLTGQTALRGFGLPLLAVFAVIALYLELGPLLASGSIGSGDALGAMLLFFLKIGIFYWLVVNTEALADALFRTFLQWGVAAGGVGMTVEMFFHPGDIVDAGLVAARPLIDFKVPWYKAYTISLPMLSLYNLAWWGIVLAFAGVALHMTMLIIEYHLAVLVALVVLPPGVLRPTAFFSEFAIGWVTGAAVRVLLTAAIVSIGLPLFSRLQFGLTAGGDPTVYTATVVLVASLFFLALAWVVPNRAAAIAGRGVSLALSGSTVIGQAASLARFGMAASGSIRGASRLIADAARAVGATK